MNIDAIHKALQYAAKQKHILSANVEAFEAIRLLNSEASGTPGLVFELYGKHGVAYDYGIDIGQELQGVAADWLKEFKWKSIVLLDRTRPGEEGRVDSVVAAGTAPEKMEVREGSLRFLVEPQHPRNVGLFLDTRELRTWLRENSSQTRVLNLFSYTCSLGLAALAGGAEEVVNVDISQRYLDWGRENLQLNGLPEEKCRFMRMDSERYLDWAAKKNHTFDQIILDPPVFSRFEKKTFRFTEDYFRLVSKSAMLLSPGGTLHAVTNYSGINAFEFEERLQEAVTSMGRYIQSIRQLPLPPDFDIAADTEERVEGNAMIFQVKV